jgi:uncharacterized protein (TIGR02996 family)
MTVSVREIAMSQEEVFLKAIIDAPDDDAPRLIFADWLDEHGDSDRAEFIRVQCALARLPREDPSRDDLWRRQQQLLTAHQKEWVRPIRAFLKGWTFRRGFIDEVKLGVRQFITHAEALWAHSPITHVSITGKNKLTAVLVGCPQLAHVTTLNLSYNGIGDEGAGALRISSALTRLEVLNLGNNGIGNSGAIALASAPCLSQLRELSLHGNHIGDYGAQVLAASPILARLQRLYLFGNNIGDAGEMALFQRGF